MPKYTFVPTTSGGTFPRDDFLWCLLLAANLCGLGAVIASAQWGKGFSASSPTAVRDLPLGLWPSRRESSRVGGFSRKRVPVSLRFRSD